MLEIIFIALLNQTNNIILETLKSDFDADIALFKPATFFNNPALYISDSSDLVIFDLNTSTGLGNAPENIQQLNENFPLVPLLVITPHEDTKFTRPLMDAGANGLLPIAPKEEELTLAVKEILKGNNYSNFP